MIYHITTPVEWTMAQERGSYVAPSLDNEGFIHCSTLEQVIPVANAFYRHEDKLILLCIDTDKLKAPLKWEAPAHPDGEPPANADDQQFPHIYGEINLDAVVNLVTIATNDTEFVLPEGLE